jgi:hypothetical protein
VRTDADPRSRNCTPGSTTTEQTQNYCWPYPLWKPGQRYGDDTNRIQIAVDSVTDAGVYRVTVTRGVPPGRPDVAVTPWLTEPMNTWETKDIWVDSSCNGYETEVGARGLRYGRRADGTVVGNGDDPCANHENRIYVRVNNIGTAPANNVTVAFNVTDPLGVGIRGDTGWQGVGVATPVEFPQLRSIPAGGYADVFTTRTPQHDLHNRPATARFSFHSCVQVIINSPPGDLVHDNTDGNGEQENFDNFEAVLLDSGQYQLPEHEIILSNVGIADGLDADRTFYLDGESDLPAGGEFQIGDGQDAITLGPKESRPLQVKVTVPPGTEPGQSWSLKASARTETVLRNDSIPPGSFASREHHTMTLVGGVAFEVRAVKPTVMTLQAFATGAGTEVKGWIDPAHGGEVVTLDFLAGDQQASRQVVTEPDGSFTYFEKEAPTKQVRGIWQGDLDHASVDTTVDVT